MLYEKKIEDYLLSNDKSKLQMDVIHNYLSTQSYWSQNIPLDIVKKAIDGSLCFSIYLEQQQIGFARVVTDCATFGYLADVFILSKYQGKGLSKQLMRFIMDYPPFKPFAVLCLQQKMRRAYTNNLGLIN